MRNLFPLSTLRNRLFFLYYFGQFSRIGVKRVDLYEQIADKTSLIFSIVELLYDTVVGRCNLGELFIGLDICKLFKLIYFISLLYIQLLHTPLPNLFPKIRKMKAEQTEIHPSLIDQRREGSYFTIAYHLQICNTIIKLM